MSVKPRAYEPPACLFCGKPLEHKPVGRPRLFCSPLCRQKAYKRRKAEAKANSLGRDNQAHPG